jgi:hypothetical protein
MLHTLKWMRGTICDAIQPDVMGFTLMKNRYSLTIPYSYKPETLKAFLKLPLINTYTDRVKCYNNCYVLT